MKKSRYTEEQIAFALKQAETGTPVAKCVSEQTFYRWKKLYGGLSVGELRRLKQLEDENRKLKQLVADLSLAGRRMNADSHPKGGERTGGPSLGPQSH